MPSKYERLGHFSIYKTTGKAQCKKCGKFLTMAGGSTRGLKRHLEDVHDIKIDDEPEGKKQKTDGASGSAQNNGGMDKFLTKRQKMDLDEILAREAAIHAVSFRYLAGSELIKKGLGCTQHNQPTHPTVSK